MSYFCYTCCQYYKHITIVNDDCSIANKFEASLTDDARVIIYDRHMFIEQATDVNVLKLFSSVVTLIANKLERLFLASLFSLYECS
jgi:hypothetical protein